VDHVALERAGVPTGVDEVVALDPAGVVSRWRGVISMVAPGSATMNSWSWARTGLVQ
jgi:hypothetical protein